MWKRSLIIKIAALALLIGLAVVCIGGGSSRESADWQTSNITLDGRVAGYPLGSVLIGDPKQIGPDVRIHMVDRLCREQECRIVAVGIDGQTHFATADVTTNPRCTCRSTMAVFSDLNLEEIEQFKFQTRPCRQTTVRLTSQSQLSNAVKKRRFVDQVCENRFFESNSIN